MTLDKILSRSRNPYEIARLANCSVQEARDAVSACTEPLPGWGRLSLQPHIISRKKAMSEWPAEDWSVIVDNRRRHDRGAVTMCQGRDGDWIIQYAIPTRTRIRRSAYFYGG